MPTLRFFAALSLAPSLVACADQPNPGNKITARQIGVEYKKLEFNIPMRDGVKLYTSVMVPTNLPGNHPMLVQRTPYSAGPYGSTVGGRRGRGKFAEAGYIIVSQDVRGRFMSEGKFEEIKPLYSLQGRKQTDESTDM